jgi:hypothetical protein
MAASFPFFERPGLGHPRRHDHRVLGLADCRLGLSQGFVQAHAAAGRVTSHRPRVRRAIGEPPGSRPADPLDVTSALLDRSLAGRHIDEKC